MCLWDLDTLAMEQLRFPSTLELLTGRFLRHSPEFYHWRIQDRLRKLREDPNNLAGYDDLAVAYDKTGQYDRAIETILAKDGQRMGLYETEANLGTFLIHAGRLEEALEHIGQAVRINPEAHFGREKYQALLVEYILDRRRCGEAAPHGQTFASFLGQKLGGGPLPEDERQAALKGVQGMMTFSRHDSPLLLEALASLLIAGESPSAEDRFLAARAFLRASYGAAGDEDRSAYRALAATALSSGPGGHPPETLERLEHTFRHELARAEGWYADVRANELRWIAAGKDPEREFSRLYYENPTAWRRWLNRWTILDILLVPAGALLIALALTGLLLRALGVVGAAR